MVVVPCIGHPCSSRWWGGGSTVGRCCKSPDVAEGIVGAKAVNRVNVGAMDGAQQGLACSGWGLSVGAVPPLASVEDALALLACAFVQVVDRF